MAIHELFAYLRVREADRAVAFYVDAFGATEKFRLVEPSDQFHGERAGTVRDPFGHEWLIGHTLETLTPAQMQERYTAMLNG